MTLFSIPAHVAFADALAHGLLERAAGDPLVLARGLVLLPNRRAVRALTDAFVRRADGGLLLPRMLPVGDLEDDGFDRLATGESRLPPAVPALRRRLELARLVRALPVAGAGPAAERGTAGRSAVEALRLGDALGDTLDALLAEEIDPARLRTVVADADLAEHWQATLAFLDIVITAWPPARDALHGSDRGSRMTALIDALIARWEAVPPAGLVVAAGISGSSPPIVRLLAAIRRLPQGLVVLPGLDADASAVGEARWSAIACHAADPLPEEDAPPPPQPPRDAEAHPQYALKLLLARLGATRADVRDWGVTTAQDGPAARTAAVMAAMAPAAAMQDGLALSPKAFDGVTAIEAATPAEEAQAIAIALRETLAHPGRTAALVTPDRGLARRVAAHCRRWGLQVDDSAGVPLRRTPPGTLALALVEALAQGFAPVALLAVLKHPLVRAGDGRGAWLGLVRRLDLALRGIRPPPGLDGISEQLDHWLGEADARRQKAGRPADALAAARQRDAALAAWWAAAAVDLEPLARLSERPETNLAALAAALAASLTALAADAAWRGPDGRALAALVEALQADGATFGAIAQGDVPALAAALMDGAVRQPPTGHPRLRILGPLESQLQRADLMILSGLNEGVWPGRPAPDPWAAPAIRAALGLPGLARATGLAAHDFVGGLGAPRVLLTRARRDASAPLVPSRFWLRLDALSGGIARDDRLITLACRIDGEGQPGPAQPPRPSPPVDRRPSSLPVTAIDTLVSDPFAFYARRILRLTPLDPLDQDPTNADRGTLIHAVLERWVKAGHGSLAQLEQFTDEMLQLETRQFPLLRALWAPRARRALAWAGAAIQAAEAEGWTAMAAEADGAMPLVPGVTLTGRADRVDRDAEGRLAVIDYKTGRVPTKAQVRAGFANQMGLLLAMAADGHLRSEAGAILPGVPHAIAYWQLGGGQKRGESIDPLKGNPPLAAADHADESIARARRLVEAYLLGSAPFEPKLVPGLAWNDYDHLARVAEWLNRPQRAGAAI